MKTKKLLSLLLAIVMVVSMMATFGLQAGAVRTDATSVCVGETYDCVSFVSSVTTFSAEEQDGNLWYFYTTDETKLKVVNCYIEEDAVEGDKLHVFLKGIAVGNGMNILCKQYDAESTSWVDGVSAINGIYNVVPASVYLDLDESTTDILDNKQLDQNYNLTVEGNEVDDTKVKLSWEITDINATRTDNKVWDTTELKWVTASSSTVIDDNGTAKFTLENYSSVMVDATVDFDTAEYATGKKFATPTLIYNEGTNTAGTDDGKITIDTANGNDTYSKTNVPTGKVAVTVTPDNTDTAFKTLAATTAKKFGTYTVTIAEHEEEPACIASGTMVTLANGTKKVIDDITVNDTLMTYNFFTGEIQGNKPIYILKNDNILSSVITLSFSDGSKLKVCDEQSFFDMDARDYFLISRKNYQTAVGKNIMQIKGGEIKTVTITAISLEKRYCTSYELATENAVNFAANNIVNTPPNYFLPGTYTVGKDMKIDDTQYQKDVAKYGLYTYNDFAKYITKNTFITGHIADLKIAVGKGLISEEDLFAGYEEWIPVIHDTNK